MENWQAISIGVVVVVAFFFIMRNRKVRERLSNLNPMKRVGGRGDPSDREE